MRIVHLAVLSLLTVAACESRPRADETGRTATDTIVTSEETRDTAIVNKETKVDVDVDTTHREGDTTVKDTLQK